MYLPSCPRTTNPPSREEMSAKRKSDAKPLPAKRGRKKKTDEDFESDASDGADDLAQDAADAKEVEVLIMDDEAPSKLPEELLKTYDRDPGQLMVAGMVTWDLSGRRVQKDQQSKVRPNLYVFHRFTEEKYRLIVSGCSSAHSVLVNMDRKAMSFGELVVCLWIYMCFIYFVFFSLRSQHIRPTGQC